MPAWNAFSFAFGPILALLGVGVMVLILRWAFSRGKSVIAASPKPGNSGEYGLLIPVSTPSTYIEGEIQRRKLEAAGLRANLANTLDGPRVMVWPADINKAKEILGS
ncbi:MAG: hypothetical protein F2923_02770 [Actinobacteria bacterium]|uniref:Unannotated protein n=1 Tax=freshwater metagenome TaxID=449393 RepID=A0A6J7F6M7_9ZZZZ|nr:hypothetical protein [Actinomycetota bacterium]MTB27544.1 hypothetical protein [Actinomycetota bacterium]